MKEVTDPALLSQLEGREVTDPSILAELEGAPSPAPSPEPNALSTFLKPFANVASSLVNLPGAAYRAVVNDVSLIRQMAREPSTIPQVAKATARGWGEALGEVAPTAATMAMGAAAAGPAGAILLPSVERYWRSRIQGESIPQASEEAATMTVGGALGTQAPSVLQWMKRAPGRYLSLPAERHATGAAIMERIPERFGVTDNMVDAAYNRARQLARQPVTVATPTPATVPSPHSALNPRLVEDGVSRLIGRGMNPTRAGEIVLTDYLKLGRTADELLPVVNRSISESTANTGQHITAARAADIARGISPPEPLPAATVGRPPVMNASLTNFENRLAGIQDSIKSNPLASLRDNPLLKSIEGALADAKAYRKTGLAPTQLDGLVKAVNTHIRQASDAPTEGAWKHVLGGLHEDMTQAAATTGDPAFGAYADAIRTARLNFLRQDLEKVLRTAIKDQRSIQSVIADPSRLTNWMRQNPDWVQNVEKAEPGLIGSINQDLQEVGRITDITGRQIPGSHYGSGRLVSAAAIGELIGRLLGMSRTTGAVLGTVLRSATLTTKFPMSQEYIRSSFRPATAGPSTAGALIGGGLGTVAPNLAERLRTSQGP